MKRLLALIPLVACALCAMGQQPYWNDLEVYRLNKVQPHDRVIPDGDQWRICLDGMWAFAYFDTPGQATLSPARWDSIRVPGNIELQGFGVPVYVNMKNEFPSNPPYAPTDYNPTGVYARTFTLPASWSGRRTIVKFGAVKSAMYLYVNGREVGYSQDSKTPAEWDITRYLRPGTNSLMAKVIRWCDGSYLECQDMWRMSGITRSVELYSVPSTYITDVKITADLDTATYSHGLLEVMVDLNREVQGGSVEIEVCGHKVGKRLEPRDWFASLQLTLDSIQPWTDTTPALYPLAIRLRDAAGRETERLTKQVGFRHIDIRNGQLRLNGQPMEIRGVNRHEHSATGGHYVSAAEMRQDIRMMKEMGINAVRTCHYPDDELWYDLCDSAGLYLWDEANVESHAQGYGEGSLAKKPEWLNPMLDRIYNMYRRDRNHPSVIVWSLGNECGNGYCMEEAYRFLKGKDNTRPVSYERAELDWNTDIVGIMYPSVDYIASYARNPENTRPYIMVEYCHAMGNSMGGLKDYWDTIGKYPLLQGGFVWDWVDQAFPMPGGWWAAGGDLGSLPDLQDDDNFCANGLLAADRTPHPHAAEVEAVYTRCRSNVVVPDATARPQAAVADFQPLWLGGTKRGGRQLTVDVGGRDFSLSISCADGSITSYRHGGRELLATPLHANFWRPPTDNDLADPNGARAWQGLDALSAKVLSVGSATNDTMAEVLMLIRYSTPDGSSLRVKQLVEVAASGAVQLSYLVMPGGQFRTLPKLGLQFGLDTTFSACTFYGNIHETYPDRRTAQRVGRWFKGMDELAAPQYVVPQEQGNREARWVRFGGEASLGVASPADQAMLNFSVRRWNDTVLTRARRWRDLPRDPYYTVSIDYRQAPLGTATCGPGVDMRYAISGDSVYCYRFVLSALRQGEMPTAEGFGPNPDMQPTLVAAEADNLAAIDTVWANRQPAVQYGEGFPLALADGRRGVVGDWAHGWAGFEGADTLLLTLDLEQPATLAEVAVGVGHSPSDWVVRPLDVQAQWSRDGRRWSPWQSLEPVRLPADVQRGSMRLRYRLEPRKAKDVGHVRLRLVGRPTLPPWHPYAGQRAWLMLDEVELRASR